jgi:hypothetical protein
MSGPHDTGGRAPLRNRRPARLRFGRGRHGGRVFRPTVIEHAARRMAVIQAAGGRAPPRPGLSRPPGTSSWAARVSRRGPNAVNVRHGPLLRPGGHSRRGPCALARLSGSRMPPRRRCELLMIAKTYFLAKTFGPYKMQFLREAKSLRDHGPIMLPPYPLCLPSGDMAVDIGLARGPRRPARIPLSQRHCSEGNARRDGPTK